MPLVGLPTREPRAPISDQRGIAVPTAVLSLLLLSTVVIGFSTLSAIEPTIANNQLRVAQARAIAEAGVEQALWALSNPSDPNGIPMTFTSAPAPYDGGRAVTVAVGPTVVGSFRVTVANGAAPYEREIVSVGWVPGEGAGRAAVQKITVTALNAQLIAKDPPAALAVAADLRAEGAVRVDARGDSSCGRKLGTLSAGRARLESARAEIYGGTDDNAIPNQVSDAGGGPIPAAAGDIATSVSGAVFDSFGLTDVDLNALRSVARARGTYLEGPVRFDASHPLPDGLVFVDTSSAVADGPSTGASVHVEGPVAADPSGVWSGWLIVNGSLSVGGEARMKGLVYAQDALSFQGPGPSIVSGAAIGRYARAGAGRTADAEPIGDVSITYDCRDARTGGGKIPGRWTVKRGSYREVSGA